MGEDYSFKINFRVRLESEREAMLLEVSREYGIEPGCRLFDRILQDHHKLIQERAVWRVEALRKKEEAEGELRRLVSGEKRGGV